MSLSQTTLARINDLLRKDLPAGFMGSVQIHLGLSETQCKADISHCIKLDASQTTLSLIDRGRKTAVK